MNLGFLYCLLLHFKVKILSCCFKISLLSKGENMEPWEVSGRSNEDTIKVSPSLGGMDTLCLFMSIRSVCCDLDSRMLEMESSSQGLT